MYICIYVCVCACACLCPCMRQFQHRIARPVPRSLYIDVAVRPVCWPPPTTLISATAGRHSERESFLWNTQGTKKKSQACHLTEDGLYHHFDPGTITVSSLKDADLYFPNGQGGRGNGCSIWQETLHVLHHLFSFTLNRWKSWALTLITLSGYYYM